MIFGDRLRTLRQEAGLVQNDVALRTGLSMPYISDLERCKVNPSLDTVVKLARAFKALINAQLPSLHAQPDSHDSRWCICAMWTYETNLSGYDYDGVVSTFDTCEEALANLSTAAKKWIGQVDEDEPRSWCVGVGIAPQPNPGWGAAPYNEPDNHKIWADYVPKNVIEQLEGGEEL